MAYMSGNDTAALTPHDCAPPPACPVCGGLECLCRPRFYAGQVLREEDLNRLERYVIDKNKLHNRYLHGSGVVCGLEVVCNPCDDRVTVRTGYALSPCGEDIVVCKNTSVLVCDLIQKCRPRLEPECDPPQPNQNDDCKDLVEDWVLAICYAEQPSRGTMPLRTGAAEPCCSSCNCGGAGGCGCGCHATQKRDYRPQHKKAALSCEPTLICEGYSFKVYRLAQGSNQGPGAPNSPFGNAQKNIPEIIKRAECCLKVLFERLPTKPNDNTPAALHTWLCELKRALLDHFAEHPFYACSVVKKLAQAVCPDPADQSFSAAAAQFLELVGLVIAEYVRYCICGALLPPCPGISTSDCVPLATVKVRRSDCQIVDICNIGVRQFALTWPNVSYWFGLTEVLALVKKALAKLCCAPLEKKKIDPNQAQGHATENNLNIPRDTRVRPNMKEQTMAFPRLLAEAGANVDRAIDAQTLVFAALNLPDLRGELFADEFEMAHPLQFLIANQVVHPLLGQVMPHGGGARSTSAAGVPHDDIAELRHQVADLQKKTEAQAKAIEALLKPK